MMPEPNRITTWWRHFQGLEKVGVVASFLFGTIGVVLTVWSMSSSDSHQTLATNMCLLGAASGVLTIIAVRVRRR